MRWECDGAGAGRGGGEGRGMKAEDAKDAPWLIPRG